MSNTGLCSHGVYILVRKTKKTSRQAAKFQKAQVLYKKIIKQKRQGEWRGDDYYFL